MVSVVSVNQTMVNAGGEVTAFAGMLTGFINALPQILTTVALTFSIIWYAIHIYDWYVLHRVTTKTTTETHSIAGIVPATKTTVEVVSTSKVQDPPNVTD